MAYSLFSMSEHRLELLFIISGYKEFDSVYEIRKVLHVAGIVNMHIGVNLCFCKSFLSDAFVLFKTYFFKRRWYQCVGRFQTEIPFRIVL